VVLKKTGRTLADELAKRSPGLGGALWLAQRLPRVLVLLERYRVGDVGVDATIRDIGCQPVASTPVPKGGTEVEILSLSIVIYAGEERHGPNLATCRVIGDEVQTILSGRIGADEWTDHEGQLVCDLFRMVKAHPEAIHIIPAYRCSRTPALGRSQVEGVPVVTI